MTWEIAQARKIADLEKALEGYKDVVARHKAIATVATDRAEHAEIFAAAALQRLDGQNPSGEQYAPQEICWGVMRALEQAGMGAVGKPNTLFAMALEAKETILALRQQLMADASAQESKILWAVGQWLELRRMHNDRHVRQPTARDIEHSPLLKRLIDGKAVFEEPPPPQGSYPWYELAEKGEAACWGLQVHDGKLQIGQTSWDILRTVREGEEWVVSYWYDYLYQEDGRRRSTTTWRVIATGQPDGLGGKKGKIRLEDGEIKIRFGKVG